MAAKRIATSAVNWGAFAELVPAEQTEFFRAFKAKSEGFVSKVHAYPESLPKIDWDFYKSHIALPGFVDKFQKAYSTLDVPYPKDVSNMKSAVDAEEKQAAIETKQFVADMHSQIESAKLFFQLHTVTFMCIEDWANSQNSGQGMISGPIEVGCRVALEADKVSKMDSIPPIAEMTHEMYADYFPEQARDPWTRPTIWPHTFIEQPGNDPNEIK